MWDILLTSVTSVAVLARLGLHGVGPSAWLPSWRAINSGHKLLVLWVVCPCTCMYCCCCKLQCSNAVRHSSILTIFQYGHRVASSGDWTGEHHFIFSYINLLLLLKQKRSLPLANPRGPRATDSIMSMCIYRPLPVPLWLLSHHHVILALTVICYMNDCYMTDYYVGLNIGGLFLMWMRSVTGDCECNSVNV